MCGIGKVNAAMCAQTMILRYHPALVINTGVAGGIGDGVHIGDIVLATDVVQHDMDTTAVGDEKGFLSGVNLVHVPCGQEVLKSLPPGGQANARYQLSRGHRCHRRSVYQRGSGAAPIDIRIGPARWREAASAKCAI